MSEELGNPWDPPSRELTAPAVGLPTAGGSGDLPGQADPARRRNRMAVAGAASSAVPALGLVLSVVGLAKAKGLDGKGRRLSLLGIALSVLFAGFYTLTALSVNYSAAWDDGCRRAMAREPWITDVFGQDQAVMVRDSTSSQWQVPLPITMYGASEDAQGFLIELQGAQAQATRGDVRSEIQRVEGDLNALIVATTSASPRQDWTSAALGVLNSIHQVMVDATALKNLCGDYTDFL